MRSGGTNERLLMLASTLLALAASACGGRNPGAGNDLPITFTDIHHDDPGAATDPGARDAQARDTGRDEEVSFQPDAPGEVAGDPGHEDDVGDAPGPTDPGQDPGSPDPGTPDPGRDAPGCGTGPACAPGTTCIDGNCDACIFHFACGADCVDCQGTATPLCLDGACVRCRVASDCGQGYWCRADTNACERCGDTDPAHCGAGCLACPTDLPVCAGGACTCTVTSCGALYCIDGACSGCDQDTACGPTCAACPVETPRCVSGACAVCRDPGDCAAGDWCDGGTCVPCGTGDPAHCGGSCAACGGDSPDCVAGACACNALSCGTGRRCVGGACQACDVDDACGSSCGACGTSTPFCVSGACRQCRTAGDCPANWDCGTDGACVDPCAGTLGCASDLSPNGLKCSTAKVLGRTVAAASLVVNGDTTGAPDSDDLPTFEDCWDANADNAYRVYLRTGDTLAVTATPLVSTYDLSLKIYKGTACAGNGMTDLVKCWHGNGDGVAENGQYTATADGWASIVVDGESGFSDQLDWGPYRMVATLTCVDAACCCR